MKKSFFYIFIVFLFSLILLGCGASGGSAMAPEPNDSIVDGTGENSGLVIESNRKIYYKVTLHIESKDVNKTSRAYSQKASEFGGFISSSNIKSSGTSTVVYRVPTEKLEEFLDCIDSDKSSTVKEKNVQSTDITSKYNQVQARLDILYSSREAYLKMLERETSLNNIISIQNKLEDIDTEITRLEYEKSSYDDIIEYSTITVYFNSTAIERSFIGDYLEYFVGVFKVIAIIILYSIPFAIIAIVVLSIIFLPKYIKKRRGKYEENKEA